MKASPISNFRKFSLMVVLACLGGLTMAALPNGFVQLEYVESDGRQYVDTGVNLRAWQNAAGGEYVSGIEMDFTPLNGKNDTADFWGCAHGNGCNLFWQAYGNYYHNGTGVTCCKVVDPGSTELKGYFNVNGDGKFRIVAGAVTNEIDSGFNCNNVNLTIFATEKEGSIFQPSSMRLRSFKIHRKSEGAWNVAYD